MVGNQPAAMPDRRQVSMDRLHDDPVIKQSLRCLDQAHRTSDDLVGIDRVRTRNFVWAPNQELNAYPCRPTVEIVRPKHEVPHFLPGANPDLDAAVIRFKTPALGLAGGAETMYPEFQAKLK